MITATLFLVFAVITILGMPIALALVGGGMAAIVAGDWDIFHIVFRGIDAAVHLRAEDVLLRR